MNSDLISRSVLLEELNNFSTRITGLVNAETLTMMKETKRSIERMIEEQPVAFDLESVIAELNERLCSKEDENRDVECVMRNKHFREAIEILNSATNATNQKECREDMKRQQAMKPKLNDMAAICPECGHSLKRCYWFCPECGQAISWLEKMSENNIRHLNI